MPQEVGQEIARLSAELRAVEVQVEVPEAEGTLAEALEMDR